MISIDLLKILLTEGEIFPFDKDEEDISDLILHKTHSKQIVSKLKLHATVVRVSYEYTTMRGNKKQGEKLFILPSLDTSVDMKNELNEWVYLNNIENKHRQLLNVKFLSSKNLAFIKL